jgi:capping protein beta
MEDKKEKIIATIDILRRLPPSKIEQNVAAVTNLIPDLADEILQKVDQPLKLGVDTKENVEYLLSEFNRDGDSYRYSTCFESTRSRSPHSNQYFPAMEEGLRPKEATREFEMKANRMFDEYRKLYFEGGICNVYCWDKPDGNFAGVILVKKGRILLIATKRVDVKNLKGVEQATWDSINVVDFTIEAESKKVHYKITSSVVIELTINNDHIGSAIFGGNLTKQVRLMHTQTKLYRK